MIMIHARIPVWNHPFKNFQGKHVALNVGFFGLFVLGLEYLQEELILNRLEILRGSLPKSGPLDFATKITFPLFFVGEEALVGIY